MRDCDLVTVIVTAYNVDECLESCLESVCGQTYESLQVIVVDDGSIGRTPEICDTWASKDSRVEVVHQENKGVSAARNKGIELARGAFIQFVDGDDLLKACAIEKAMGAGEAGSLTVFGYETFCELAPSRTYRPRSIVYEDGAETVLSPGEFLGLFQKGLFGACFNKLYDAEALRVHGIRFDESMNLGEDIVFNVDYLVASRADMKVLNSPLYRYREHRKGSLVNSYNPLFADSQVRIYDSMRRAMERLEVPETDYETVAFLELSALLVSLDNLHDNKSLMPPTEYQGELSRVLEVIRRRREDLRLSGIKKMMIDLRVAMVSHGMISLDRGMRDLAKKALGLM